SVSAASTRWCARRWRTVPETRIVEAEPPLDRMAVDLVIAVRASGVTVPTGATVTYARALTAAGSTPAGAYWAGRATLVRRPEDIAAYDRAFGEVFGGVDGTESVTPPRQVEIRLEVED